MELVIMAAGMGSRFGGLKQLEPVDSNGNFIIDYSIFDAIRCGFDKVVFIIKEENYDDFRETIGKRVEEKIKTEYVFQNNSNIPDSYHIPEERKKPFGTGHAVLCAKDAVSSNFAVINADDFYGYDAFRVVSNFLKNTGGENQYALVGYNAANTIGKSGSVKRGICSSENGILKTITESSITKTENGLIAKAIDGSDDTEKEIPDDTIVSMNMFGFTPNFLTQMSGEFIDFLNNNRQNLSTCEFFLPTVVSNLIQKGVAETSVLETSAVWFGITYREDKQEVEEALAEMVKAGIYPENLWN